MLLSVYGTDKANGGTPTFFKYFNLTVRGQMVSATGALTLFDRQTLAFRLYGKEALYSEVYTNDYSFNKTAYNLPRLRLFTYTNNRTYAGMPYYSALVQMWLQIDFWQDEYPEEFEDIEILPGEFTRLRNEINRKTKLQTDYMPSYMHEKIKLIIGCDDIRIDDVSYIQRDAYTITYPNKQYALAKGEVSLTEKTSIIRNVI